MEKIYKPIKRKTVSEEVADQITELVIQKHLSPGDRLPTERQLVEDLGVSRTALREAMKALSERGLVDVKQGNGTFIRHPSSSDMSSRFSLFLKNDVVRYLQLMDVREILEIEIAGRLASGTATAAEIDKMQQHLDRMHGLLDSPAEYAQEDVAFHVEFYRAMKNEVLLIFMEAIMQLLGDAMEATFIAPGSAESSLRRHQKLLDCIRNHDVESARQVMREIIARGRERLSEAMPVAK